MVWRKGLFGQIGACGIVSFLSHRRQMFLPGDITARILDGARGVAQMIAWPKIVVLQHAAMSVTRSMQHRRRSLTTRHLTQTLTLVYIMTRRFVHKHFDHYHLLITYGKFHMFGYSRLHIDIYPDFSCVSFCCFVAQSIVLYGALDREPVLWPTLPAVNKQSNK